MKVQIWDIVSLCGFAEVFYSTLPDASLDIYSIAYVLGLLMPTIIFSIAYSIDVLNNPILNLFAPCAGAYLVVLMYLLDVLTVQFRSTTSITDEVGRSSRSTSSSEAGFTAVDIFNACIDYSIAREPSRSGIDSMTITENPLCDIEMRKSAAAPGTTDSLSVTSSETETSNVIVIEKNITQSSSKTQSSWRAAWLRAKGRMNKPKVDNTGQIKSLSTMDIPEESSFWTRLYLPRQIYDYILELPVGKVKRNTNRLWLWFVTTCYIVSVQGFYFFLNFFTIAFRKVPEYDNFQRIKLFILYIIVCMILKTIIKRIGMYLDCMKENTSSLFFLGEIAGLMFYFTFYRVLFESIVVWWEFLLFQVMHILSEWILYPCRASQYFYQKQKAFIEMLPWTEKDTQKDKIDGLGYEDWLDFICLDFGFRVFIELTSGFSMLFYFLLIDYVPWIHYGLKQTSPNDVGSTALLIAIALIVELVSAFTMNKYFFIPKNKNIRNIVDNSFRNPKFGFLAFTFCAMELINPLDAFIDAPTFG